MTEAVRCTACELRQFPQANGNCRRCHKPLLSGAVDTCKVIVVREPTSEPQTLKQIIFTAAVASRDRHGSNKLAAQELRIPQNYLRLILKRGNAYVDFRKPENRQKYVKAENPQKK